MIPNVNNDTKYIYVIRDAIASRNNKNNDGGMSIQIHPNVLSGTLYGRCTAGRKELITVQK